MGKALPEELRKRAVEAYLHDEEATIAQVAQRFQIGVASLYRWVKLFRETGSLQPKPPSGGNPTQKLFETHEQAVALWLEQAQGQMTQQQIADKIQQEFDIYVCQATVFGLLKRMGYTFKKIRFVMTGPKE